MAAGVLVDGVCRDQLSTQDYISSLNPIAFTSGSTSYYANQVWNAAANGWKFERHSIASGGNDTTLALSAVTVTYPVCDTTETFFDGVTIGWAIAAALATAWAIQQLRRAL